MISQDKEIKMIRSFKKIYSFTTNISSEESDNTEIRFHRSILILATLILIPLSLGWGTIYYIFGEADAAVPAFAFGILSLLNLAVLFARKNFGFFQFVQSMLILVVPFIVRFLLGGYVNGSAVILWAFISPLGALLLKKVKQAYYLLFGFVGLTILSGIIDPLTQSSNQMPQAVILILYLLNIILVTSICFVLISYYFQQTTIIKEQFNILKVHIDQAKRKEELNTITESDFFKRLEEAINLRKMEQSLEKMIETQME